jgi:hypothetical protein
LESPAAREQLGGPIVRSDVVRRAFEVFSDDLVAVPSTTLRSGDAIDGYEAAIPFDAELDEPTDAYLELYTFWGQEFLDPGSWRHYLPRWIDYALRHANDRATMVVDGLLASLRPPDREPPRLASLTSAQEAVILAFLQHAATSAEPVYDAALARQVMEEWWIPNARYRPPSGAGA